MNRPDPHKNTPRYPSFSHIKGAQIISLATVACILNACENSSTKGTTTPEKTSLPIIKTLGEVMVDPPKSEKPPVKQPSDIVNPPGVISVPGRIPVDSE